MLSNTDLLALADANLAEFAREHARWLPPTHIHEQADRLLVAAGTGFPAGPWNCLMALGSGLAETHAAQAAIEQAQAAIEQAQAFFADKRRGFSIYVRAHADPALYAACQSAGYPRISDSPGMVLCEPLSAGVLGAHVTLREVRNAADAAAFVEVVASAYETLQLPAAIARKLLSQAARWVVPHVHTLLVMEGGRAVAGAMLLFSHGIAGVYWVGTLPYARRRGHAELVMRSISNHAFECGARAVVLQASALGEPLYRRLGYQEFTRYASYLVPTALKPQPR